MTRHSSVVFLCAAAFLLLMEAGAALLTTGCFVTPADDVAAQMPAMTRLGDLRGSFTDMQGNRMTFADLRGKVVLVNLWATWCPPCRAELPSLDGLWKRFEGNDGVRVLCISTEKAEVVRAHPVSGSVNMPLYVFDSEVPEELSAEGLPTTYIFDTRGRVVFGHMGMADWNTPEVASFLEKLHAGAAN